MRTASPFTRATMSGKGVGSGVIRSIAGGAPGLADGEARPGGGEDCRPPGPEQPKATSKNHADPARFFPKDSSRVAPASLSTMDKRLGGPPGQCQGRDSIGGMFSARTRFELQPNRLSLARETKRRDRIPVLALTESNPTRAGLPYPADLLGPLADPAALRYAPEARGLLAARVAVSADHARRGLRVEPERLFLT